MDVTTGREFSYVNPQDDPHLYPQPPPGFAYSYKGTLMGFPRAEWSFSPRNVPQTGLGNGSSTAFCCPPDYDVVMSVWYFEERKKAFLEKASKRKRRK